MKKVLMIVIGIATINQYCHGVVSTSLEEYANTLTTNMQSLYNIKDVIPTRRQMIVDYCSSLLKHDILKNGFIDQAGIYNPKKSFFLYQLCMNVDEKFKENFDKDVQTSTVYSMKKVSSNCSDKMNECNIGVAVSKLYTNVMNDLGNIKLAQIYGYKNNTEIEKAIRQYSDVYFGEGLCKDKFYLRKEILNDKEIMFCSHPQTYKILSQYIQRGAEMIKKLEVINKDIIEKSKLENPNDCSIEKENFNRYACAFTTNYSDQRAFQTITYNELLFYQAFMDYYIYTIGTNTKYKTLKTVGNINDELDELADDKNTAIEELTLTYKTTEGMMRMLKNMYVMFPVHIGLSAYTEDILYFRTYLNKIYTPVSQLYYLLRNAQEQ